MKGEPTKKSGREPEISISPIRTNLGPQHPGLYRGSPSLSHTLAPVPADRASKSRLFIP